MAVTTANYEIAWEKLPDDFALPDDPVDNINQPILAATLTESLEIGGKIPSNTIAVIKCAPTLKIKYALRI
jgi:hypothetical protein